MKAEDNLPIYIYLFTAVFFSNSTVYSFFFLIFGMHFKIFISFWLCWLFVATHGLSLVAVHGLLVVVTSLVAEHGL